MKRAVFSYIGIGITSFACFVALYAASICEDSGCENRNHLPGQLRAIIIAVIVIALFGILGSIRQSSSDRLPPIGRWWGHSILPLGCLWIITLHVIAYLSWIHWFSSTQSSYPGPLYEGSLILAIALPFMSKWAKPGNSYFIISTAITAIVWLSSFAVYLILSK